MNNATIADTSLQAYYGNQKTQNTDRDKVFHIINKHEPISGSLIARKMEKPYHTITGRITELRKQERIEISGYTTNRYGNKVRTYQVKK